MNYWVAIYRFALGLLIVLALLGIVFVFVPPAKTIRSYQARRIELEAENRQLEEQIRDLIEKQARFRTDPAFVERTAREVGMIKSNEVSHRLED
jgi:cell division protein FtsB